LRTWRRKPAAGHSFPYHVDDLDQSFQDIGDELRNQYSIAYIPTNLYSRRNITGIRIESAQPQGYQVRARRGLFCQGQQTTPRQAPMQAERRFKVI